MFSNYVRPLGVALCLFVLRPVDATSIDGKLSLSQSESPDKQAPPSFNLSVEPTGALLLPQALALTLTKNPYLAAFSEEIRAQEAVELQAGLIPNPVFDANAANFGNKAARGFDGDVVTLALSQLIELGGKRAARIQVAQIGREVADWDYEIQRVTVLAGAAASLYRCAGHPGAYRTDQAFAGTRGKSCSNRQQSGQGRKSVAD